MIVRALRPDEWELARDLRLRALELAPEAFRSSLERERAFEEQDWRGRLEPGTRPSITLVAGEQGRACGFVGGIADESDPDTAWLVGMWVEPEHRRRGAGQALTAGVVEWARGVGARRLLLGVAEGNVAAERLYRRLGFRPTGRSERRREDLVEIELELEL